MSPDTFGEGGGWAYNRMDVLFTGRRAYSGGGGGRGNGGSRPSDKRRGRSTSP